MFLVTDRDPLEAIAIEYLDLYSLYDILDQSGVTQEEVLVHLLKTGFIAVPPYLEPLVYEEDEDNE